MQHFSFQWQITDACDMRCRHCYVFGRNAAAGASFMPWETMLRVIREIAAFAREREVVPYVYLTGGDPLLHPDFWRLVDELTGAGIRFGVLGNPFHLTREACRRLAQAGCSMYQMSLDGLEKTNDELRKPGSFAATMAAIGLLREAGVPASIMATVSKRNAAEMPHLIDCVVEAGVDAFAFARLCPTRGEADECCAPEEYRALLDACAKRFRHWREAGASTRFPLKDHLWMLYRYEEGLLDLGAYPHDDEIWDGCHCGRTHLTIRPDGTMEACSRMESPVGSICEKTPTVKRHEHVSTGSKPCTNERCDENDATAIDALTATGLGEGKPVSSAANIDSRGVGRNPGLVATIYDSPALEVYRDVTRLEKCTTCELLRFCRGCPAVAANATGSMWAADPQCWKKR